jgi:hypothetical protein
LVMLVVAGNFSFFLSISHSIDYEDVRADHG